MEDRSRKPTWHEWMEMAVESQLAAKACLKDGRHRSAASRAYYAAYQAATAAIHYAGRSTPPAIKPGETREAWQHGQTPFILETDLVDNIIRKRDDRKAVRSWLRELYNIRIQADYVASSNLFSSDVALKRAIRRTGFVIKAIQSALPQRISHGQ